jgi:hypothetical protein
VTGAAQIPRRTHYGWYGSKRLVVRNLAWQSMMQSFLSILGLFVCLVFPIVAAAQANEYYVSSAGSDSNDGSQARPWATLNHANAAMVVGSGGTACGSSNIGVCVHVLPGIYSGPITTSKNGTAGAHVRYYSETQYGARLIGSSGSNILWTEHGKYTDIVGFDFDGSVNSGINTAILTFASDAPIHALILNNKAHDFAHNGPVGNGAGVIASCGITSGAPSQPCADTLEGNLVYHNNGGAAAAPYCCNGNVGMDLGWGDIARNNIIMDQGGGVCLQAGHSANAVTMTNNTVLACTRGGILLGFLLGGTADFSTISNNIVANSGNNGGISGIRVASDGCGPHNIYANNLLYGNLPLNYQFDNCSNTATGTQSGSNSTTFVNYTGTGSGDYHLKAGSAAIGNGTAACASTTSSCAPTVDFSGNVRPLGSLDISAFQFAVVAGGPAAPTGLTASVN